MTLLHTEHEQHSTSSETDLDTIHAMIQMQSGYIGNDYLERREKQAGSPVSVLESLPEDKALLARDASKALVHSESRIRVCEWMFKVVDYFSYERESVSIAMSYFDRYVGGHCQEINENELELISLVSLYIAIKLHDTMRRSIIRDFVQLGSGRFTRTEIEAMEQKIITGLSWKLNPPTPQSFGRHMLQYLLPASVPQVHQQTILGVANSIMELATFESNFLTEKPSSIAFVSIMMAISQVSYTCLCEKSRVLFNHKVEKSGFIADDDNLQLIRVNFERALKSHSLDLGSIQSTIDPDNTIYPPIVQEMQ